MRSLILALIALAFSGCKKDVSSTVENLGASISAFEYHRVIESETDTKIFVISSLANFGHDGINTNRTYIKTGHNEKSPLFSNPRLSFNDELVLPLNNPIGPNVVAHNTDFESLYGRDLSLSVGDETKSVNILADYVPNLIMLKNVNEYPLKIEESTQIEWNEDVNNSYPVYLIIRYSPLDNPDLAEDFPNEEVAFVAMPDDGSYTFSKSDFPNIPEQSLAIMTIVRGAGDLAEIAHNNVTSSLSFTVSSMTNGYVKLH